MSLVLPGFPVHARRQPFPCPATGRRHLGSLQRCRIDLQPDRAGARGGLRGPRTALHTASEAPPPLGRAAGCPRGRGTTPTPRTLSRKPCSRRLRRSETSNLAASARSRRICARRSSTGSGTNYGRKDGGPMRPTSTTSRPTAPRRRLNEPLVTRRSNATSTRSRDSSLRNARPLSGGSRWATRTRSWPRPPQADAGRGTQGGPKGARAAGGGAETRRRVKACSPTSPAPFSTATRSTGRRPSPARTSRNARFSIRSGCWPASPTFIVLCRFPR